MERTSKPEDQILGNYEKCLMILYFTAISKMKKLYTLALAPKIKS
jgi:hypothetical protein